MAYWRNDTDPLLKFEVVAGKEEKFIKFMTAHFDSFPDLIKGLREYFNDDPQPTSVLQSEVDPTDPLLPEDEDGQCSSCYNSTTCHHSVILE